MSRSEGSLEKSCSTEHVWANRLVLRVLRAGHAGPSACIYRLPPTQNILIPLIAYRRSRCTNNSASPREVIEMKPQELTSSHESRIASINPSRLVKRKAGNQFGPIFWRLMTCGLIVAAAALVVKTTSIRLQGDSRHRMAARDSATDSGKNSQSFLARSRRYPSRPSSWLTPS